MEKSRKLREKSIPFSLGQPSDYTPGPLDNDARFNAPARQLKILAQLEKLLPCAKRWIGSANQIRLYFSDRSFLVVDPTGRIESNGGLSTKAFLRYGLGTFPFVPKTASFTKDPALLDEAQRLAKVNALQTKELDRQRRLQRKRRRTRGPGTHSGASNNAFQDPAS